MLSSKLITRKSADKIASYYEDGVDDYYAKDSDSTQWYGKGAETLGLRGPVDEAQFRALLAGRVNGKTIRTSTRHDMKNRVAMDLTLNAPKGVSLEILLKKNAVMLAAHDKAVSETVQHIESMARTRIQENYKSRLVDTGNLIFATFRHETSRATEDTPPYPHIHTHLVIPNMTLRDDGQWRAIVNDEMFKSKKYLGTVYRAALARELTAAGYELRYGRDGLFDLAHISEAQIRGFSARSGQVVRALADEGLTRDTASEAHKQSIVMRSRAKKVKVDRVELQAQWEKRARELGIRFEPPTHRRVRSVATTPIEGLPAQEAALRAVKFAVNKLGERQAVLGRRELQDTALRHSMGRATHTDIAKAMRDLTKSGYLVQGETRYFAAGDMKAPGQTREQWIELLKQKGLDHDAARDRVAHAIKVGGLAPGEVQYTTQRELDRERAILALEARGRQQLPPIMSRARVTVAITDKKLSDGQKEAITLMASTDNRVVGVQGFAGTGKSHMLRTAKKVLEAEGYVVKAVAPYGSQTKALRTLGMPSQTMASWLRARDKGIDDKTVLVIDESSVVPTRQMDQALRIAETAGARVVLIGDKAQTLAIEAGKPFVQLQDAGMPVAHMRDIKRQEDPELLTAVALAAQHKPVQSLAHISDIIELKDDSTRRAAVATAFTALPQEDREKTLILSGTNDGRREINADVRAQLGTAGRGIEFDTLIRRDTTQAERRYSRYYRIGDVIQPERDYDKAGIKRGVLYTISETGPDNVLTVTPVDQPATSIQFSPALATKLSVYQPERSEFAQGDRVRITRNDARLDLANGDRYTVVSVASDKLTLTDGKRTVELNADKPLHVDHAYATTVHSAQGLTDDGVMVEADSRSSTTDKATWYVAISRARRRVTIFTDDASRLPAAITRDHEKYSALDMPRMVHHHQQRVAQHP